MLVLSRKEGERVQVGAGAFVTVERIRGGRVRLGFEFPADVRIVRAELEDKPPDPSAVPAEAK